MNDLNKIESGRSMVEMLGVLAIIGVLSVGGISGYTTAMNKHKANEILNAAAVRAMAVSTQLQNGSTTPSLGEFTEHEVGGATFTDGPVTSSGGKFTIGFVTGSEPSEAVLKQMEQIAGTDGIVRKITDGGLIYNDDLSTEVRASDFDNDSTNCVGPKYHLCSGSDRCLDVGVECSTSCSGTAPTCKSACDENGAWVVGENDVDKPCKLSPTSTENDGVCNASGECAEPVAACPDTATTTAVSNSLPFDYEGATCYCPVTDGHAFYSTGKNKCVEYKIVGNDDLTHPAAHNACTGGWTIASKTNDFEKDFVQAYDNDPDVDMETYGADLARKIGWSKWSYFLWLKECYSGCPDNLADETNDSGYAWTVGANGDVGTGARDHYNYALWVR